ncbi:NAD-dependent epimerase/dehydratase family protein [Stratiformator vulcanicus]|uniref:dTDP-glucose 4,6-dehydratase n=1 Tax=Stratiformator vulcanicus TaxID=2527980 RepID=A0A517R264_9PLAN|nr:NAD-dependent epimerase/dehydratase family protein [Stratiformator vulcanicus]QDT37962.1 dTDP-glucose 4,6-dehydratase [Stratiformator vulcanicus]
MWKSSAISLACSGKKTSTWLYKSSDASFRNLNEAQISDRIASSRERVGNEHSRCGTPFSLSPVGGKVVRLHSCGVVPRGYYLRRLANYLVSLSFRPDFFSVPNCNWNTMSRCLVTGGAGFIGSHLVERLLDQGHSVDVLDNVSTGDLVNLRGVVDHPEFRFFQGSITDPIAVTEAVRGADVIYHLAAAVGVKLVADDPVRTIETNIDPTDAMLRLAVQGGQKFFLASTSEVYGKNPREVWSEVDDLVFGPTTKPRWAYGCSKAIDEFLALAYHQKFGLDVVIGRFFNVVGPRQVGDYGMVVPRFLEKAKRGEELTIYDDGSQVRCFAHVREVVDAVTTLMETPAAVGEVVNIGSDRAVSIKELADAAIRVAGSDSKVCYKTYESAYGSNFEDIRRRVPDVSKLERLTGQKPSMPLDEILSDILNTPVNGK